MSECREFAETAGDLSVRGFLHDPKAGGDDGLVLTHGAGANCRSALLTGVATAFCDAGVTVLRFDLPFRQTRPFGPPPRGSADRDQQAIKLAASLLRQRVSGRVFLAGHSYGGRMASMLAATDANIASGLLLLSYPLHPPKRREELRTKHFPQLHTPALFVSGTRDGFGSADELATAVKLIPARTELLTISAARHDLLTKANREELPALIVKTFREFFAGD